MYYLLLDLFNANHGVSDKVTFMDFFEKNNRTIFDVDTGRSKLKGIDQIVHGQVDEHFKKMQRRMK